MGKLFSRSARLFAKPSFIEGFARIIDLGATLNVYNCDKASEDADIKAIKSDWYAVGDSISSAVNKYNKQDER